MKTKEKEALHLPILIEQDEDGVYIVSCPSFKKAAIPTAKKTVEEALKNIREVIDMCLAKKFQPGN